MGLRLFVECLPHYPAAFEALAAGVKTAIKLTGEASPEQKVQFQNGVGNEWHSLVLDPQTSGGFLISIAAERAERLLTRLKDDGVENAAICGEVFAADMPVVLVR